MCLPLSDWDLLHLDVAMRQKAKRSLTVIKYQGNGKRAGSGTVGRSTALSQVPRQKVCSPDFVAGTLGTSDTVPA